MLTRRSPIALGSAAAACLLSATLVAQTQNAQNPTKKLSDAQKKEIQATVTLVNNVAAGQPAPNDLGLTWLRTDLLKAEGNRQYAPFTVAIDPSKVAGNTVSLYWRVVSTTPPPPPAADAKTDRNAKPATPEYAYEDFATVNVKRDQPGPFRVSRSFSVGPGSYDVYVAVKEPTQDKRNAPVPKASVIKESAEVPNLWTEELTTSSLIIAERIDPLPAPLTPEQMVDRPYALGTMEIVPAFDTKFTKKAEISTFLLIYNAKTDAANKPDVSVEYNFYSKQGGTETFFNKTNPQNLNAQTLPPQFDTAAGHQLQSGQAVPLASFPEGDYRLEIKVTDKLANKSLTRDVNFSVSGS